MFKSSALKSGATHQSKAPPSQLKISKGSDLNIRGAPSVQGLILRVQDLRQRSDLENQGAPSVQGPTLGVEVLL